MRDWRSTLGLVSLLVLVVFALNAAVPMEAWAGPGGVFVKAAARSPFVRVALAVIAILFLPFIVYVYAREWLGVLKTRRDLSILAKSRPEYSWGLIDEQANAAIRAVYAGWKLGDLAPATEHMTPHYLESQVALLERWREEGKRNVCELKRLDGLSPLWIRAESDTEYATLALLVSGRQLDYLEEVETRRVIKGDRDKAEDFESVWLFSHQQERWCVYAIQPGNNSLAYARMPNRATLDHAALQPAVSHPAATQARDHDAAAQHEGAQQRVARGQNR